MSNEGLKSFIMIPSRKANQKDGTTGRIEWIFINVLNSEILIQFISKFGNVEWSDRTLDLTPTEFFIYF